jgi:hypothetical protein
MARQAPGQNERIPTSCALQAADARAALQYVLSLGVKASYAVEKEAIWRWAGVSLGRLRANTAALAEELHMDAKQARPATRGDGISMTASA